MSSCALRVLYPFPEPLPQGKARAIQVIKTVASLAEQGIEVDLAYVPVSGEGNVFAHYGMTQPPGVRLVPLSRGLPWPLHGLRMHSNRLFFWRLQRVMRLAREYGSGHGILLVRHLKLAHAVLARYPDRPLVYEAHEVFSAGARPGKAEKLAVLEREVLERATVVIAISQGLVDSLKERYDIRREIVVLPSATDLPGCVTEKDWNDAAHGITYVGNLYPWKGAQDLVDAAALLPGCTITIIGGSADRIAGLRARASPHGAAVNFLGHLPHKQAVAQLERTCIAVLPNRAESVSAFTSPLKLFEYMAYGCAVVASDLPVFREVLAAEDAAWFAPGDAAGLAAAIRNLVEQPEQAAAIGQRLRDKVTKYTWTARASRIARIMAACSPGSAIGK